MSISSFKLPVSILILFILIDRIIFPHVDLSPLPEEWKYPLYQRIVYRKFIHNRVRRLEKILREGNIRIPIVGTSRTLTGLSPQVLEEEMGLPPGSVLNLSLPAQSYWDILLFLRKNLPFIRKASLLIIEVSSSQFYYPYAPYMEVKGNILERLSWSIRYHDFHQIPSLLLVSYRKREFIQGYLRRWLRWGVKRFTGYSPREEEIRNIVLKDFQPGGEGWVKAVGRIDPSIAGIDLMDRALFPSPSTPEREGENFSRLLQFLEKENLSVLFVEMPVNIKVIQRTEKENPHLMEFYRNRVKSLLREKKFPLWEAKNLKMKESYFYDWNHLNVEGALYLSRELGKWLKENFSSL